MFATDDDDPTSPNGQIDYSIQGGALGQFRIEQNNGSGSIFTDSGAKFDFERQKVYTLIVSI